MGSPTFRAGVVIVVTDSVGRVMTFERLDQPGAWQLPQGGIDIDEFPEQAAWRELREETGLGADTVELVGGHPEWIAYEWPADLAARMRPNRDGPLKQLGQVHRWFWFRVRSDDVTPQPDGVEFGAWRWTNPEPLIEEVAEFRRRAYRRGFELGPPSTSSSAAPAVQQER